MATPYAPWRIALPIAFALGCSGSIDGSRPGAPGQPPGSPATPSGGTALPPIGSSPLEPDRSTAACKEVSPGPAPVRRLTRAEFDNTVRDLIGEDERLAQGFPPEELHAGFDNNAEVRSVSDLLAEGYSSAAEQVARAVTSKLDAMLACDPARDGEPACLDRFLDGLGKRIWRRPLAPGERDDLKKVFAAGRTTRFAEGIDAVVQVMMLSPQFLYRFETGLAVPGAGYARLTPWEMASRLSYFFWGTMPDPALMAAAESGKLATRDEVMAQARRLIDDPRATAMVTNFGEQWLELRDLADADKDPAAFPKYREELRDLWKQETDSFLAAVWNGDAKLDTLLSAPFSMMNGPLAAFYGLPGVGGDSFAKVMLDPTQRAGVLTQGALMAAKSGPDQTSPVLRGVFVRQQMLCQPLPPPPPEVNAMPPMLNAKMTTKERFAAHRMNPACASCHDLIDNLGFGFENLDPIGLYRSTENGKPVDASGQFMGTDVDGPFTGAVEMARKLVASKQVEGCMATHWFDFAFGRSKTDQDACTSETLGRLFASSGGDFRQLLLAITQSDAFFFKGGPQ
jgi:uncharacterized protein DUF1592/uncharacterized protein DUF1588/uncharacterized protein DUF1587/uncharacterized protein DUF1585/uncharacterized protein DUF1595